LQTDRDAFEEIMATRRFAGQMAALPPLSAANARADRRDCKICGAAAEFFDVVDFNKFCNVTDYYAFGRSGVPVCYWRCVDCGFLFTDFCDDWSPEHFRRWIYNADYTLVDPGYSEIRPVQLSQEVGRRLRGLGSIAILDYGSGAGVMTERLRRQGFAGAMNFDPYSSPTKPAGLFDLVTCFEVMEHSPDPIATLKDMKAFLRPGGCILFGQTLQPANIAEIRANWWYVAPRNGHLSCYTEESLARLAEHAEMTFCGREHLFLFRGAQASPVTERLYREFGPTLIARRLFAPGLDGEAAGNQESDFEWHAMERHPRGTFRWTARATVTWPLDSLPIYPCDLLVTIPLLGRAYPGVLDAATLSIGAASAPARVSATEIRARIGVADSGAREISLRTQQPRSPADLRGASDSRPLGISIFTAQVAAANPGRRTQGRFGAQLSAPWFGSLRNWLGAKAARWMRKRSARQRPPDPLP
jgi:SAM-dependent methyltransferase